MESDLAVIFLRPGDIDLGSHLGEPEAAVLEAPDGSAERGALLGVVEGELKRRLGAGDGADRNRQTFLGKVGDERVSKRPAARSRDT